MGKVSNFLIGAALGVAVGLVINYLFAPAPGTEFNKSYRSRLDQAIEEGKKAAEDHERELRQQLEAAKREAPSGSG
jgi:gas vesicle protein